jgi:hypothetical protein
MIVIETTEDKFGKAMKAISKIYEHADCLHDLFEEMAESSNYSDRYGNRKRYDDDDMYGSRYGMRGGRRRY